MAALAALDDEPLAGRSGREVAGRRSQAVDQAVRDLFAPFAASGLTLVAVGGYGRRELCPGSDVDLMILRPEASEEEAAAADAVLYPLWDAGLPVGHSVRTPAECAREAAARLESLTALLDARPLTGSAELFDQATGAVLSLAADGSSLAARLIASRTERETRFGRLGEMLEPDLKESLGGLRDVAMPRWLAREGGPRRPAAEADPGGFLLLVRTALHRVTRSRTNRLAADHQTAVAALIGLADEPGWEARDALMRDVFGVARRVDLAVSGALDRLVHPGEPGLAGGRGRAGEASEVAGVLPQLIPGWEQVRGRPQRDPYHRYPVDVHLLRAADEAARLLRQPDEPFAVEAARAVRDPEALLLGALLHDIGKVGTGSHVAIGTQVAARVMDHLGAKGERKDHVLFLVREHLLLSDTATRRNLGDEDLILHVAARVADQERLGMLYLLTVADALATGPSAATPWRLGLIRELVAKVSRVFERGQMDPDRAGRLERAEAAARTELADRAPDQVARFLRDVPPGYLLWVTPGDVPAHLDLVTPPPGPAEVRIHVAPGRADGTFALTVVATDRLGLLGSIAGGLTLSGLSILTSRAFTTESGLAMDTFEVRGSFEEDVGQERWERFRSTLTDALAGRVDLVERILALRTHYRSPAPGVPVKVRIDQAASDFHTVVEVWGPDRIGLLHDLARTFADLQLDVHLAKVATYGPRVVDVFYVTDVAGWKIDTAMEAALERSLARAVAS